MAKNHKHDDDIDDLIAAKTGGLVTEDDFDEQDELPMVTPVAEKIVAPEPSEAAKTPLVAPMLSRKFENLPDGSIRGLVIISAENAELLKNWAEGAGEPLETYIENHVNEALLAYANVTMEG